MIPEWMKTSDNYIPENEANHYINKSIYELIKINAMIRQRKIGDKWIYKINPSVKVMSTFLIILLTAVSRNFYFMGVTAGFILINFLLIEKMVRKYVALRSLLLPVITLIALLPSFFMGNPLNSLLIVVKVIMTITLTTLLSHSTDWSDISKSLKLIFIPDLFIWILEITIKYIFVLGEYSIELFFALKLKSIGKISNKYEYLTGLMGNLFIKVYRISEEMFYAMECKGFTGEYIRKTKFALNKNDLLYLSMTAFVTAAFFAVGI